MLFLLFLKDKLYSKNFFKKTIVKKGQTCYNLFKVKKGQRKFDIKILIRRA